MMSERETQSRQATGKPQYADGAAKARHKLSADIAGCQATGVGALRHVRTAIDRPREKSGKG